MTGAGLWELFDVVADVDVEVVADVDAGGDADVDVGADEGVGEGVDADGGVDAGGDDEPIDVNAGDGSMALLDVAGLDHRVRELSGDDDFGPEATTTMATNRQQNRNQVS